MKCLVILIFFYYIHIIFYNLITDFQENMLKNRFSVPTYRYIMLLPLHLMVGRLSLILKLTKVKAIENCLFIL